MAHPLVSCRSSQQEQKAYFIQVLLSLKPQWYTRQGLESCPLPSLEAELQMHARWDVRAQAALAQPWVPPSIVHHHLAATTGPVEHLATPRLRPWPGDGWTPPAITGRRGA